MRRHWSVSASEYSPHGNRLLRGAAASIEVVKALGYSSTHCAGGRSVTGRAAQSVRLWRRFWTACSATRASPSSGGGTTAASAAASAATRAPTRSTTTSRRFGGSDSTRPCVRPSIESNPVPTDAACWQPPQALQPAAAAVQPPAGSAARSLGLSVLHSDVLLSQRRQSGLRRCASACNVAAIWTRARRKCEVR